MVTNVKLSLFALRQCKFSNEGCLSNNGENCDIIIEK